MSLLASTYFSILNDYDYKSCCIYSLIYAAADIF